MATTASESAIASAFLREMRAPDTLIMRRAVVAWLHMESGHTIIGNNPWNLRPGADDAGMRSGTRTSSMGNGEFSVYPDPITGARAAAHRLVSAGHDWRRYDAVVAAARRGSALGFLNALAASAWDAGRYGTKAGGSNKLIAAFNAVRGMGTVTLYDPLPNAGGGSMPDTPTTYNLAAWGDVVSFPVGHTLTAADVDGIMAALATHGFFANDPAGVAQSITAAALRSEIGNQWGKPMQDRLQAKLFTAANEAVPKTPLDPLLGVAGAIAQILAALFDPHKWLLILALIAGVSLTAWGGTNIAHAAA